ncbi:unnamed protein product [Cochlearia groenlandica]
MSMDLELDDDVFFADISKQISLLIMDEDEKLLNPNVPLSNSSSSSLSFHDLVRGSYQAAPYMYHQEQSKGTGVFIPKASHPIRRYNQKQSRFSSLNAKQQQQQQNRQEYHQQNLDNSRSTLITHNNNNNNYNKNSGVHASITRRAYMDPTSIYSLLN